MDLLKKTNLYVSKQKVAHLKEEAPLHCEINLPEYFSDIAHILKCSMEPNIQTVLQSQDKILIEGMASLKILYVNDEKIPRCYCQNLTFSKTIDSKEYTPSYLKATAKTEYLNCRVPSPRTMEMRGALSIEVEVFTTHQEELLCSCKGAHVETKTEKGKATDLLDCASLLFPITETVELPEAKSSVGEMVRNYAEVVLESTKIVSGKVLLKGKLHIDFVYISKEPEYKMETMSYSLPFSQIAELPNAKENAKMLTDVWVSGLEILPKADASGTLRLLECKGLIGVFLECYEEQEKEMLLDAYSTKYDVECAQQQLRLLHMAEQLEDVFLCRSSIELEDLHVTEICSVQPISIQQKAKISKGKLTVYGSVIYEILYCNAQKEWKVIEKKENFQYERAVATLADAVTPEIFLSPHGIEFLFTASDHLDIRFEMHIEAYLFLQEEKHVLSDINVLDSVKAQKHAALTVYFAKEKETLWDIARKYNTTVASIQTENQIQGDILENQCTLFIPKA